VLKVKIFSLKLLTGTLQFVAFVLAVYLIAGLSNWQKDLQAVTQLKAKAKMGNIRYEQEPESVYDPLELYAQEFKQRDIFRLKPPAEVLVASATLADATEGLRVVGISWGDEPEVLIEQVKPQKTYFLKQGEKVGSLEVKEIFQDRVVLRSEGKDRELILK